MGSKRLSISENYLQEVMSYQSKKLCGKLMKRFEIIDNKDALKKMAKELIYESFRDFRDILIAHNYGIEQTVFEYKIGEQNTRRNKSI